MFIYFHVTWLRNQHYSIKQKMRRKRSGDRYLWRISRNGKCLATSTPRLSSSVFGLVSRLVYSALLFSRHPLSVSLPMGNDWRASAHTGLVLFPFGASWSVVSPCASASEIFIPDCCRTAVSLVYRSISLRALSTATFCNIEPACRSGSRMAARE